jgi:hypothetical protein
LHSCYHSAIEKTLNAVAIALGHPGVVAATRRGVMLADTSHHETICADPANVPRKLRHAGAMLWEGEYITLLTSSRRRHDAPETGGAHRLSPLDWSRCRPEC